MKLKTALRHLAKWGIKYEEVTNRDARNPFDRHHYEVRHNGKCMRFGSERGKVVYCQVSPSEDALLEVRWHAWLRRASFNAGIRYLLQ